MSCDNQLNQGIPNILIVDDIPDNLKVLGDILRGEGYKVRPVTNGLLALQVAQKEIPDIILLDILMPNMDGFEVCKQLKENPLLKEVPIIFISALNDTDDIVKALTMGGVDYIGKPFKDKEVKVRVATHLKIHRQNKELHELNACKDKFFSLIAHDLRSPFNGFLGLTEIMAEELSGMTLEEIREITVNLRSSATSLNRLLENLLIWAQIQRGLIPFYPAVEQLLPIVTESISVVLQSAKNKNIEIHYDVPDDIFVFVDNNQLQTVIRNLVSNSVKFTPNGGIVNITAKSTDNNTIEFAIKDTGIGMNSIMVENLFRVDVRTKREGTEGEPSTGLGLILCKDFIEKMGSVIRVESQEGKGSAFYFTLPYVKNEI